MRWRGTRLAVLLACLIVSAGSLDAPADASIQPTASRAEAVDRWLDEHAEGSRYESRMYKSPSWGEIRAVESNGDAVVYLFVFDWPKGRVLFAPDVGGDIAAVALGSVEGDRRPWRLVDDGLLVGVADDQASGSFEVIAVSCRGGAVVFEQPRMVGVEPAFIDSARLSLDTRSGLAIRFTTDGTDPTQRSALFESPIELNATTEVRARSYYNGRPVSGVVKQRFERLEEAWPARKVGTLPGLVEEEYGGLWSRMPKFDDMKPKAVRTKPQFGFPSGTTPGETGLRQRGIVSVPNTGIYAFELVSDDGGKLWIDGRLVIDHDGPHGATAKVGTAPLMAGGHDIVVEYFNATGGSALRVRMRLGDAPFEQIPEPSLTHDAEGDDQ